MHGHRYIIPIKLYSLYFIIGGFSKRENLPTNPYSLNDSYLLSKVLLCSMSKSIGVVI